MILATQTIQTRNVIEKSLNLAGLISSVRKVGNEPRRSEEKGILQTARQVGLTGMSNSYSGSMEHPQFCASSIKNLKKTKSFQKISSFSSFRSDLPLTKSVGSKQES